MTVKGRQESQPKNGHRLMSDPEYKANNYEHLLGMSGFSDKALQTHFKLYQGYVAHTNKYTEMLKDLVSKGDAGGPAYTEIKRRWGWEWNGMRLHEYYFGNMGGKKTTLEPGGPLHQLISIQFGDVLTWKKDFVAAGAMRGIGWVILYQDIESGKLFNAWIEEHNTNHLAGGQPLLVMDVFEHAYLIDYGTDRDKYITNFFLNINWSVVEQRIGVDAS